MPIYEYRCRKCSRTFEKYSAGQGEASGKGPACPHCGKKETEKIFSLFASQCGSAGPAPTGSSGGCGSGGFS